jgi:hypothetical protein
MGVPSVSDEALLTGFATGDRDAAAGFVRRFQTGVYGLAVTILGDPEAAEDVAQETFVRAWRHASSYDARRGAVSSWFYAQRAQADLKPGRGEILVGAIDCKGIPMVKPERALRVVRRAKGEKANKKRMATVAAVHSQAPVHRTPEEVLSSLFATDERPQRPKRTPPHRKWVWASLLADKDTFIADVKAEMVKRDPRHRRTWVIVTDGERALQRRVCQTFTDVTLVLDLLHVLEKLWKPGTPSTGRAAAKPRSSSISAPNGSSTETSARSSRACA